MADQTADACTLYFGDVEIYIEGSPNFVGRLHGRLDNELRTLMAPATDPDERQPHVVVHHIMGDITKVYAAPVTELEERLVGKMLSARRIRRVFLDGVSLAVAINPLHKRTLWSHLQSGAYKNVDPRPVGRAPHAVTRPHLIANETHEFDPAMAGVVMEAVPVPPDVTEAPKSAEPGASDEAPTRKLQAVPAPQLASERAAPGRSQRSGTLRISPDLGAVVKDKE